MVVTDLLPYQAGRNGDGPGSQVLPQALGLGVGPRGGSDARSQDALDNEVNRTQARQLVPAYAQVRCLGQQGAEQPDRQLGGEPVVGRARTGPESDVGVAALVARPSTGDPPERHLDQRIV